MNCSIPVSYLHASPFSIPWAGSVNAKVIAVNAYGISVESNAGNGGYLQSNPDSPVNLTENLAYRTTTNLGITWTAGSNSGSAIIDYWVQYDQGTGTFVNASTNVVGTLYVQTGLTIGVNY
jgi:hypothetical protein